MIFTAIAPLIVHNAATDSTFHLKAIRAHSLAFVKIDIVYSSGGGGGGGGGRMFKRRSKMLMIKLYSSVHVDTP